MSATPRILAVAGRRVAFTGSRNATKLSEDVKKMIRNAGTVLHGNAIGFDSLVDEYARECGLKIEKYLPAAFDLGPKPFLDRNRAMVDAADLVIAGFDDGMVKSRGTGYTANYAHKSGKPCLIYHVQTPDDHLRFLTNSLNLNTGGINDWETITSEVEITYEHDLVDKIQKVMLTSLSVNHMNCIYDIVNKIYKFNFADTGKGDVLPSWKWTPVYPPFGLMVDIENGTFRFLNIAYEEIEPHNDVMRWLVEYLTSYRLSYKYANPDWVHI